MSFFRYPGGKSKLREPITEALVKQGIIDREYREPFFGGGSIGIHLLKNHREIKKIWINDKDFGIACLWTALINFPEELKNRIRAFKPSVEAFYEFRSELLIVDNIEDPVDIGFKKIAIHQISYSGLGTKSGGPLGGAKQTSEYRIDCRWSPDYICSKIDKINGILSGLEVRHGICTEYDFDHLIADQTPSLLYLDPPYYDKGDALYQCSFKNNHSRLAEALKCTSHAWVLSYDDCPEIHDYYQDWADITRIDDVNCTITVSKDKKYRKKSELLITKRINCH